MDDTFRQFRAKLDELFQMDRAELDFGIYRIMNIKRGEIRRYLEEDLYPQVEEILAEAASDDARAIQEELEKKIAQAEELGVDPESLDAVKELRTRLAATTSPEELRQRTFSHLLTFFGRYYDKGDFISKRRYKDGTYMIPYNGEEVKLVWANMDQYYIKTSEYLRDYRFFLNAEKTLRMTFKLVEGDTERDNIKGKNRIFQLRSEEPVTFTDEGLVAYFEYLLSDSNQKEANARAYATILEQADRYRPYLEQKDEKSGKTLLEKHLAGYTARNSEDYFIHKDLKGFLERELDFFLKNEVLRIDDLIGNDGEGMQAELHLARAIKEVGGKIIAMLAQIEEFQKKLWLKRKMVTSTNYLVTLDKIIEKAPELLSEIAANDGQRKEWVRLFAIDEISADSGSLPGMGGVAYSEPLTEEFLRANDKLVVDTRFFDRDFVATLLAGFDDIDEETDGLLVHSENFQALNLLQERYREKVKCIYIDPPYNTESSSIPYKNDYRHSSFAALMQDRIRMLRKLLNNSGVLFLSIDKAERLTVQHALDNAFGNDNRVEELIWSMNTNDGRSPTYSTNHEYVEVYAKSKPRVEAEFSIFREPKPGYAEVMELVRELEPKRPSIADVEEALAHLYEEHKREYRQDIESKDLVWETEKRNDPWKGIYPYKYAEYRDANGRFVSEDSARTGHSSVNIWVYRESDWTIMSSDSKQSDSIKDPSHPNYRFYDIVHPETGVPCSRSTRGWKGTRFIDSNHPDRNSLESLMNDHRIAFGKDEQKVPQQKRFLHEVESNVAKSVFVDYSDGEKETTAMFGRTGVFLAPKHSRFVSRFVRQAVGKDDIVVDCFGGSGSTAHAVISFNRTEDARNKFLLVEMAQYFDTVLRPRVARAIYSQTWLQGKPESRDTGVSQLVKYIRLESYEDTLNNLTVPQQGEYSTLLEQGVDRDFREGYLLGYMLDWEAGAARMTTERFAHPFESILNVAGDTVGERRPVTVDLVETFNYLIGLTVKSYYEVEGCRIVEGYDPAGDHVLIVWRDLDKTGNDALNELFLKQRINIRDREFDLIYVNGDNNLENIRREDESWKVRLIEHEFTARMFAESI